MSTPSIIHRLLTHQSPLNATISSYRRTCNIAIAPEVHIPSRSRRAIALHRLRCKTSREALCGRVMNKVDHRKWGTDPNIPQATDRPARDHTDTHHSRRGHKKRKAIGTENANKLKKLQLEEAIGPLHSWKYAPNCQASTTAFRHDKKTDECT